MAGTLGIEPKPQKSKFCVLTFTLYPNIVAGDEGIEPPLQGFGDPPTSSYLISHIECTSKQA